MSFLIGRSLANNVANLMLDPVTKRLVLEKNLDWPSLLDQEPDAGLGNGGLGASRLLLDSMATLQLRPWAMGCAMSTASSGSRSRRLAAGEADNWLQRPDPWEIVRLDDKVEVKLNCSFELRGGSLRAIGRANPRP